MGRCFIEHDDGTSTLIYASGADGKETYRNAEVIASIKSNIVQRISEKVSELVKLQPELLLANWEE